MTQILCYSLLLFIVLNITDSCPVTTDSCTCSQSDNTAAVVGGVVVAVVFIIMGALAVIVISVLVLRYRRGNGKSTGRKKKYIMTLCNNIILYSYIHVCSDLQWSTQ